MGDFLGITRIHVHVCVFVYVLFTCKGGGIHFSPPVQFAWWAHIHYFLSFWVYETYIVHYLNGTGLRCALLTCIVHHQPTLWTMVYKGDLCPWEVGVAPNIFHFLVVHMEHEWNGQFLSIFLWLTTNMQRMWDTYHVPKCLFIDKGNFNYME